MQISETKAARLRALSTSGGVIAALAMDQRRSLRRMIALGAGVPAKKISDAQVSDFKAAVTRVLSAHASAILLDPEFGSGAFDSRANNCGLLMTYEMDGYDNPRPHRMLALMPDLSARRLRDMGADGIKILLSYTPFDDPAANDEKKATIERIGHECEAAGVPFFLEPVGYDRDGLDPRSLEFARRKPEIVIRSMEEFSKDIYKVDVLKVEFPVSIDFVEGTSVFCGQRAYSREQALECYRQADAVARRPYIYLSAGVSTGEFLESIALATEAQARYCGVLCGRATWQGGVNAFAREGVVAFEQWLQDEGVRNIRAVNDALQSAVGWQTWNGTPKRVEAVPTR